MRKKTVTELHNMIQAWEPDIFEQEIHNFDHVLGIYTDYQEDKTIMKTEVI